MKNKLHIIFAFFLVLMFIQTGSRAQGVSINTAGSPPDGSAMLDVSAANRGVLIPRVSLTGLTDQSTIASPATYLTVYNTNAAIGNGAGMYFWNGSSWSYMAAPANGAGTNGQVLTSQGSGQAPQWNAIPAQGGGGSICACFNNYRVFTSSGTFTTSAATTLVKVQVWGGGGGGSGSETTDGGSGAGGAGGGYAEGIFTVTPSTNYNVTIGTGGAGGAADGGTGGTGGNSSFDILISATGGGGASFNTESGGLPGQGGIGQGGYINSSLGCGGSGGYGGNLAAQSGANGGGSCGGGLYGGGGGGGVGGGVGGTYNSSGSNASANTGAGGGGAGYGTAGSGGNGASGMVVVYY